MSKLIDGIDFEEISIQKYWAPPASWTVDKKRAETINRIFSGEWCGSQKRDGALYVFVKNMDGTIILRGRSRSVNGIYLDKWDHLPHLHDWAKDIPCGTCLLGEVYWAGNESAKNTTSIMNCLTEKAISRQSEEKNKLHYYIFDILALDGHSLLHTRAADRFYAIEELIKDFPSPYVEAARYVEGEELWDTLQNILANGYEGMVIIRKDSLYEPDKRPSKTTMKVKKELQQTIDCFFTGRAMPPAKEYTGKEIQEWSYWLNERTGEKINKKMYDSYFNGEPYTPITKSYFFGFAGSLEIAVMKDGKVKPIGWISGLTEEVKQNYTKYKGAVVEVTAMERFTDTEGGGLRHARILRWRDDKKYTDCDWSQIEQ